MSEPITVLVEDVATTAEKERYASLMRREAMYYLAVLLPLCFLRFFSWIGEKAEAAEETIDLPAYRMRNERHEIMKRWHRAARKIREAASDTASGEQK